MSSICQNQIALCKLHNCAACEFHGREGECPLLNATSDATTPTLGEMLAIYAERSSACPRKRKGVIASVKNDIQLLGLSVESKCTEITWSRLNELTNILRDPNRPSGPLRDYSVRSHLDAFAALTSRKFTQYYIAIGKDLPRFSIPSIEITDFVKQSMTDDQERMFDILMERWLASNTRSGRNLFIYGFFLQEFGIRPSDIFRLKWGNIKFTREGIMIVFVPHKTSKSRPDLIQSIPMASKQYSKIKPLIGAPDEYVIPVLENYTPPNGKKDGDYCGMHRYLTSKFNEDVHRECGIGGEYKHAKIGYVFRKKRMTDDAAKYGDAYAAKIGGDREDMAKKHYISDRTTRFGE